jgi:hypothetical protein
LACLQQCDASHPRQLDPRLVQVVTAAVAVDAAKASAANAQPVPASEPSSSTSSASSSSRRTLTINGETYTGGDRLGQPCSLDEPCPGGYKCHLVTSRSGQCVQ